MNRVGAGLVAGLCAVVLLAAVIALGIANPLRPTSIGTDALGPDGDQDAASYVDEAATTLTGTDTDARWALVSFGRYLRAPEIAVADARVSVVYVHAPIDRVQTPLHAVRVPDTDEVVARAVRDAASLVFAGADARATAVAEVVRSRYVDDCACVAGVLVRADLPGLRRVAELPDVRAVEALEPDAIFGRFSVLPLYPDRTTAAVMPDDGAVPVR